MGGRELPIFTSLFIFSAFLTAPTSAQERSAPAGAVTVRPVQVREVQVREVRVDPPAPPPSHPHEQRPSFGIERPVNPGFISRPIARPQPSVAPPPQRRHRSSGSRGHRPFYTFTPRYNTGYGVVVGFPVLYPYAYGDPFSPAASATYAPAAPGPNTYSNVESLSSSPGVTASSPHSGAIACEGAAPCGGVSFDITPASAQISVDGAFAGVVDDFTATGDPLLLAPGSHYIELRLAGYRTATFEVTVASGEVTPYQGTLERLRLLRTP